MPRPTTSRDRAPVSAPARVPGGTFPRRIPGHCGDGRRWDLFTSSAGVVAETPSGPVAEARVDGEDGSGGPVVIDLWFGEAAVPEELAAHLVEQAFAHPAVRPRRPVVVCLPRRHGQVLGHVRRHLTGARSRAAGVTCLVEGEVAAPPGRDPSRP
ncbi:hypothetical protein [Trujillonella humicola]|uniref:hypothetical protein n=1 Tax=Trujillonella humicola TaxID=3383699 RepID=UPI0039060DAD